MTGKRLFIYIFETLKTEAMKRIALITGWAFLLALVSISIHAQNGFDRAKFYQAMGEKNVKEIDEQIALVEKSSLTEKQAFAGALQMKKAGLISGAGKKLSMFKEGHKKLEASIDKDVNNTEYRFLRIMIQENAPGILGYKDDLKKDSEYLRENFKNLPEAAKKAVLDYSKNSKVLKSADFN
jgi:hypothetical protein